MEIADARRRYVRWLLATRDLSPHTVRAYDGDISAFERHMGRKAVVGAVDRESLLGFLDAQRKMGLSSASIRRRAAGLRSFCRWLLSHGLVESDPWVGVGMSAGRSRTLPRVLTGLELDRLLTFLRRAAGMNGAVSAKAVSRRPHESTTLFAVALMVTTGVRVNEVVGIECGQVDLPDRTLRLIGKGRRERQVYLTNDWISRLASAYLEMRDGLSLGHTQLLFNLRHEPLTPPAMRSRLAKGASAAGIRRRVTPHMLRHTAATQLIEAGVDIRYIQRLLGHASLSTTEIYTHVSDTALKRVVSDADVLGRLVGAR